MKFFIALALITLNVTAAMAAPAIQGKWKLADAFCTNPGYKLNPDEQAFIDAIHHKGDVWTDDVVEMQTATLGKWTTKTTISGLACVTSYKLEMKFGDDNSVELLFTEGKVEPINGSDPNKTITCSPPPDAVEKYYLDITETHFDFFNKGSECGEYRMRFLKQ